MDLPRAVRRVRLSGDWDGTADEAEQNVEWCPVRLFAEGNTSQLVVSGPRTDHHGLGTGVLLLAQILIVPEQQIEEEVPRDGRCGT